jgi:hypothetical protein
MSHWGQGITTPLFGIDTGLDPTTVWDDFNFFIFPNAILLLYIVTFFTSKKVTKEGGSCSQALPPMDGRYLKNAGAVFLSATLRASPEKALRNSSPKNAPQTVLA